MADVPGVSDRWWWLALAAIAGAVFLRLAHVANGSGYWPAVLSMLSADGGLLAVALVSAAIVGVAIALLLALRSPRNEPRRLR